MAKSRPTKQEKMETLISDLRGIDSSLENSLLDLYQTQSRVDNLRAKRATLQREISELTKDRKKVKKNV